MKRRSKLAKLLSKLVHLSKVNNIVKSWENSKNLLHHVLPYHAMVIWVFLTFVFLQCTEVAGFGVSWEAVCFSWQRTHTWASVWASGAECLWAGVLVVCLWGSLILPERRLQDSTEMMHELPEGNSAHCGFTTPHSCLAAFKFVYVCVLSRVFVFFFPRSVLSPPCEGWEGQGAMPGQSFEKRETNETKKAKNFSYQLWCTDWIISL